jgi:uncharacterized protein
MSRTRTLVDLQTTDQQRAQVAARLAQIEARLADDSAVAAARAAAADASARHEAVDKGLRAAQAQRASIQEHIAIEEAKLYGGQIKAPKELQNLQREVAALRRRLSEADDRTLELMLARDAAEAEVHAARAALAAAEAQAASTDESLAAERNKLVAARQRLEPARQRLAAALPAADLALYERLWRQHRGRPLAQLRGPHCGGCGMQLPQPILERVGGQGDLVQCSHCGRVLVPAG